MAKSKTPTRDAVLVKYLNEAYGKEKQLETALKAQIGVAQRSSLKKGLEQHLTVTKDQAKGLKARIKALGGTAETGPDLPVPQVAVTVAASAANKAIAAAKGPIQVFRGSSPADNELRNVRDCYWNEAEEIAHYNAIEAIAEALGDTETAQLARKYRRQEQTMQTLLERELAKIAKDVVRDEVPKSERPTRRRTTKRRATKTTKRQTKTAKRS